MLDSLFVKWLNVIEGIFSCGLQLLASIKNDKTLGAFFVHDTVTTFSASNRISWTNFIVVMTFSANVHHSLLWRTVSFGGFHFIHDSCTNVLLRINA